MSLIAPPLNQTLQVMVVDDSKVQREFARDLCRAQGWSVVAWASDGLEALLKLKEGETPDLLLLDLEMPGLNGIDLLQELARLSLSLPICILSSRELSLLESVAQMGRQLGLNIIQATQKPLRSEVLQGLRLTSPQSMANSPAASISRDAFYAAIDGLCTLYTPCVSIQTGLIHHLSARLAWPHNQRGVLFPADYANELQSDKEFLRLMANHLQQGLQQIAAWKACGSSMAVQFELPWLAMQSALHARSLLDQIQQLAIAENKITFEIAIEAEDQHLASHLSALNLLRIQNIGLAIREPLAEFAWVKQARKVPFSQLVLSSACLAQREHDPLMPALIEQSIKLAQQLNMTVHIEGVNTLADWQCLHQWGANTAQGPLIGHALTADDVIPWMKENLSTLRQLAEQAQR